MRIGLLSDCYRPGVNGIVRFLTLHRRALEEAGHQALVFTFGPPHAEDEPGTLRSPGVPFLRPGYHLSLGYSRRALEALRTCDVLHANQPAMSGLLAIRYGRRFGIPTVLTCHSRYDLLWKTALPLVPLALYRRMLGAAIGRITAACDRVIVTSHEAARVMRTLGVAQPLAVIPIGVDLARLGCARRTLTRAELGLPAQAPLAVTVGRLAPEKNVGLLLRALAQPALAEAHLLVVGEGPERGALETLARRLGVERRVHFVGQAALEDVPAYAALADVFVTGSLVEMLPVSAIEALAVGLPVLGPEVAWIRELVRPGENGLLAAPEPHPFAEAWARLNADRALRARLGAGARLSAARYDIRQTTAELVALYEGLAAG